MDYRMVMEAKPYLFRRAGEAWESLGDEFDKIIGKFRNQVCDALDDDTVWRGQAQEAATGHGKRIRTEMRDYRDKIAPVAKALTTAAEDIETYQRRLEGLQNEINEHEDWSMDATGNIEGPQEQRAKYEGYVGERDGLIAKAEEADQAASRILASADVSLEFLNQVLAEERGEEEQAAKEASKLAATAPDELTFEEGKRLARMLRNHGEDPAFAGEFVERVQPNQLLKLTEQLQSMGVGDWDYHGQGSGPNRDEVISSLQRELGETLAAGTGPEGSEYLGDDLHDESKEGTLDQRAANYGKRLMAAAEDWDTGLFGLGDHEDAGYRAVGMLLHSGEYSEEFLNPVGDGLVAADREDSFDPLNGNNLNHVDGRGRGGDPMIGLMTALENSPDAAGSFFDPAREGNDDNLSHLLNRDWPPDTYDHAPGPRHDTTPRPEEEALGHDLLGNALESATLEGQYRTAEGSRVMSDMVHQLANSDQSMHDPGQGTVPPPMRDSVGRMLSDYMGAVQDSGGAHANTSESLRLDGADPDWTTDTDGFIQPKFSQHEVFKVMGSAAYAPNAYAAMRDANTVQTELRLDDLADNDSASMDSRRGAMEKLTNRSQEVFGGLDEARAYAIDEFYDGKDAAYNAKIEAGGTLATWAVTGVGGSMGGLGGAAGSAVGADVVDQAVDDLKQDSSHIVTSETSQLKENGWNDANNLLAQSLWEHRMWNEDVPPPPIAPGSEQLGDHPGRIVNSDGSMPDDYVDWVQKHGPFGVDQQTVKNTYDTGAEIYADATGNRPVPVSETE